MNRQELDVLTSFCAAQRDHFLADDWTSRELSAVDGRMLALVAKYLSMTSWFGHEEELAGIAELMYPGFAMESAFADLVCEMDVDFADISTTLRLWPAVH